MSFCPLLLQGVSINSVTVCLILIAKWILCTHFVPDFKTLMDTIKVYIIEIRSCGCSGFLRCSIFLKSGYILDVSVFSHLTLLV
jgi:hypothetical protein